MTKPNFETADRRQFAAGRILAGVQLDEAAAGARVEAEALQLFEEGGGDLTVAERRRLGRFLSDAGVVFRAATILAGPGVRLRDGLDLGGERPREYRGRAACAAARRRRR